MHPRLLLTLALLLAICVEECDAAKFFSRWREGKKKLRGQKPAEAKPAEEVMPVEAKPAVGAAGAADVTIEKQPETPLKTQIGASTPKRFSSRLCQVPTTATWECTMQWDLLAWDLLLEWV